MKIIKFCGIKSRRDIDFCNMTMPTHVGFVFAEKSKRYVDPAEVFGYLKNLSDKIKKVGVFVNSTELDVVSFSSLLNLDVIQLHGDEDCEFIEHIRKALEIKGLNNVEIWKAVKVTEENLRNESCISVGENIQHIGSMAADKILLDGTTPGSGEVSNWELIKKYRPEKPFILAGGLNIGNIENAITQLNPSGIDISSGIETDGVKDIEKMKKVIEILN